MHAAGDTKSGAFDWNLNGFHFFFVCACEL